MIETSEAFAAQMGCNARKIYVRFLRNNAVVEGNLKEVTVNKGACGDGEFAVGSIYSSYINATIDDCPIRLENEELELQIGTELPDGTIEYCTVGLYTVSDVAASVGTTTFTGLGRLSTRFGGAYFSENGFPQSISSTLDEIAQQTGVTIDTSAWDNNLLDLDIETSMNGLLHREAVMYIAGLLGGFATENHTGGVVIRPFSGIPVVEMDSDRTTEMYSFKDYDYTVTGVTVLVSAAEGEEAEVSYSYGTPNLTLSNPYMTKALFDMMALQITGLTYRPGSVPVSMGDIRLEAGDVVTARDAAGESYVVPCLNLVHTYDGGLMTTITAPGASTTEQETAFTGSLTAAVQRTATELLVAKNVIATKIEAVNASITALTADKLDASALTAYRAEVENLLADKADVTDLTALQAQVTQLDANKASITDLTATNASLTNVTADVANISALLAGNAGVGVLQAIHLTGTNAVIDDAIITDAMIASLTASKLTAGTIYTSLIKIASDENENLLIDGSTLQIKDASGITRVQIGKDAAGDYNLALWGADGALLWDASGVYAAGLHDGIIRDVAIADDANINQSKIDMASVAKRLNEDGSITVDASRVQVDNTTLAAAYKTVTTNVTAAQTSANNALTNAANAQTSANTAQAAADAARESIDNLEVGGRNLLPDSDRNTLTKTSGRYNRYFSDTGFASSCAPVFVEISDPPASGIKYAVEAAVTAAFSGARNLCWYNGGLIPLIDGETYTMSCYARVTSGSGGIRFQYGHSPYYNKAFQVTGAWKQYSHTFTFDASTWNGAMGTRIYIGGASGAYVGVVQTCGFKLERGTIPTDWTVAPEDAEAAITAVTERTTALETSLSVVQGQIAAKVWQSDITAVTDPLGTQVTTLADNYSALSLTVDGVQTRVGAVETTTDGLSSRMSVAESAITQQADQISLKVSRDGIISEINQTSEAVTINANRINLTDVFAQDITATGTIRGVKLEAATGAFSGKITVTSGTVGGWSITDWGLQKTATKAGRNLLYYIQYADDSNAGESVFGVRQTDSDGTFSYPFAAYYDGAVRCTQLTCNDTATIAGNLSLANGKSIYIKNNGGTERCVASVSLSLDEIHLGDSNIVTRLYGTTVYVQKALTVTGAATLSGTLSVANTLTVTGAAALAGVTCTNLAASGSVSTYGYTIPRIQHGSVSVTLTAGTPGTFTVTFPKAFGSTPVIVFTPIHNSNVTSISYKIMSRSAAGFTGYVISSGGGTYVFNWIAMCG